MTRPTRKTRRAGSKGTKTKKWTFSPRKVVEYREVKGKTLDKVEFSTSSGFHAISLQFEDKTDLTFVIDACFTTEANYSDWKTGNERPIVRWAPVHSVL